MATAELRSGGTLAWLRLESLVAAVVKDPLAAHVLNLLPVDVLDPSRQCFVPIVLKILQVHMLGAHLAEALVWHGGLFTSDTGVSRIRPVVCFR